MPVYEYVCPKCGKFDHLQHGFDPIGACPICGNPVVKSSIYRVGVVYKGSGFYITDNRNDAYAKGT
jgi:putative FmdB family regulatory protein